MMSVRLFLLQARRRAIGRSMQRALHTRSPRIARLEELARQLNKRIAEITFRPRSRP